MIECSEEANEEENFGEDKEDYSISQAFLDDGCVVSLESAFSYNVSSSLVYG